MLSFLIPTYREDCSPLVAALLLQGRQLCSETAADAEAFSFEILVMDDGSGDGTAARLQALWGETPEVRLLLENRNAGLATARNRLAEEARGEHLIFMDSDARVCTDNFVKAYWLARNDADVVCGALRNPPPPPPLGHELRFLYERHAEPHRTAEWRNANPYRNFSAFNVLVHRRVISRLRFDERCRQYGYEDTLFGLELRRKNFTISHADIPLLHSGIDSNESFLRKTETSLRTLRSLGEPLASGVGVSRFCARLRRCGLLPLLRLSFRLSRGLLRRNLLGRRPSLLLFAAYKAGYYSTLS